MKFYGQWDPPVDKILFTDYFPNKIGGTFIECGAFDGVLESSCKFFEEFREWTGVNIEPSPPIFSKLCINRPNSQNIRAALSNTNGTAKFKHAIHPTMGINFGNGSIKHTKEHYDDLKQQGCTFKEYDVSTITWDTMIDQTKIKQLDLLVLDIEGHEIEVLKCMSKDSVLPNVICIEHGHIGSSINKYLEKLGYNLNQKRFNNSFYVK
jgi:FkbM family methyltransferase